MAFHFNLDKTMQAIAALLHFHGTKEMSYLRLLKILYIADRESLKETGRPITGDHVVAMEHLGVRRVVEAAHFQCEITFRGHDLDRDARLSQPLRRLPARIVRKICRTLGSLLA